MTDEQMDEWMDGQTDKLTSVFLKCMGGKYENFYTEITVVVAVAVVENISLKLGMIKDI